MIHLRNLVKRATRSLGFEIRRSAVEPPSGVPLVTASPDQSADWREIAQDIIGFTAKVPLLYDDSVPKPIRVGGAWREGLIRDRAAQTKSIADGDVCALAALLEKMFFNELCRGLQDYGYFGGQSFAEPAFLTAVERFEFVTGIARAEIATDLRLPLWGIAVVNRILKYTDPNHAMQALTALRLIEQPVPVVVDLGSGFGGMAEKLARLHPGPIDIWLVDIPHNLTTAYAYLCAMFGRDSVKMLPDGAAIAALGPNNGRQRFLLVPTILIERVPERVDVVNNCGSLSEMDYTTVAFYLETLVPRTAYFVETNSNRSSVNWGHVEVKSSDFPIPDTHRLVTRYIPFDAPGSSWRYVTSIYQRA